MDIQNTFVAIAEASSSIGRATAMLLAERGAAVVLGTRREERWAVIAGKISAAGGQAGYRVTDVAHRQDLQALVDFACERFGRVEVLVNVDVPTCADRLRLADRGLPAVMNWSVP